MNPEQKAAVEVAEHLHSIEEFQRDVEPAIVAARNEFLTQETIVGLFANDFIDEIYPDSTPLYSLRARSYTFSETDADRIRDVYDAKLKPLGFTMWEKRDSEMVLSVWTNASYSGLVWFCGPGVLRVVGCYWWCCAHWRAYWLGESQPSALWGCSSL